MNIDWNNLKLALIRRIPGSILGVSPEAFTAHLLDKAKIAVVLGEAFGDSTEGTIRISYANSYENLEKAMDKMETAIKTI